MAPLPAVREPARPSPMLRGRAPLGPLGLAAALVAALAAGVVALVLAAAVAFAALLMAAVAFLTFAAWRLRRGRRDVRGWREARIGPAWVGYRWEGRGPAGHSAGRG